MKNLYIATLLSALIALPIASQARPGGNAQFIAQYDTDGDGRVSREELAAARAAEFTAADTDGNSAVSLEELQALQDAKQAERLSTAFAALDTDSSTSISATEFVAGMTRLSEADANALFTFADSNTDLSLDLAEFAILKSEEGRLWKRFVKLDSDDNGVISQEEYTASRTRSNH